MACWISGKNAALLLKSGLIDDMSLKVCSISKGWIATASVSNSAPGAEGQGVRVRMSNEIGPKVLSYLTLKLNFNKLD